MSCTRSPLYDHGAALHVPPEGLGTALHDGSGRLMFVQGYGVALGVCGTGVTKDALQGCLHVVSIAVYTYSYTLSYPLASTSIQRLSILHLFPREAGLFNAFAHRQNYERLRVILS